MQIKTFPNGLLSSNAYVVWDKNECMIVDLGVKVKYLEEFIKDKKGLTVKYLVLTHGHYDHANYIGEYIEAFPNARVICHTDEYKVLTDKIANVSYLVGEPCTYNYDYTFVNNGDTLTIGDSKLKVLNFPGHTPGCICLLDEQSKIMLTGDVIFAQGYGRTDFLYGDSSLMRASLLQIAKMDEEITIYPGHGESAKLKYIF